MIARVWRGWATPANAIAYETHFRTAVLPHLAEVSGFLGADLLRREEGAESELVVIRYFDAGDVIRAFAGDDSEQAVVTPEAQRLLARFQQRAAHYDVLHARESEVGRRNSEAGSPQVGCFVDGSQKGNGAARR